MGLKRIIRCPNCHRVVVLGKPRENRLVSGGGGVSTGSKESDIQHGLVAQRFLNQGLQGGGQFNRDGSRLFDPAGDCREAGNRLGSPVGDRG